MPIVLLPESAREINSGCRGALESVTEQLVELFRLEPGRNAPHDPHEAIIDGDQVPDFVPRSLVVVVHSHFAERNEAVGVFKTIDVYLTTKDKLERAFQ